MKRPTHAIKENDMYRLPNDQKWHDNLALITENLEVSAGYIDPKLDDVHFDDMPQK